MRNWRIAILACFCLCCSRIALAQSISGSTNLDIDADSGTVTVTCETDTDPIAEGYYTAEVVCTVTDSNNTVVAQGGDSESTGTAQVVLTFAGTPGETYTAIGKHQALAVFTLETENPSGLIVRGFDDVYNFNSFSEDPQTYDGFFEWDGPGPEIQTRTDLVTIGDTEAMGTPPQIPTSLKFLKATVLPTGTTGNSGCAPTADYGIKIDIMYQVLDQANHPILQSGMTPIEAVQGAGGKPGFNPIGPTDNSNSSATTASDGTFHDVPFGLCSDAAFSNLTQLQIIYINSTSQKVRQNAFTYSSSSAGHGTMSNGNDVSAMR